MIASVDLEIEIKKANGWFTFSIPSFIQFIFLSAQPDRLNFVPAVGQGDFETLGAARTDFGGVWFGSVQFCLGQAGQAGPFGFVWYSRLAGTG
ncbi:hypothetical protein EYC84_009802 [Monilinia fructicola]|uniref:Uncharacterized protein n=1 Tax=Monilinia fructicola TaxID=38448 RepID=A0A5M9J9T7_MONFR|nr:hypothetical protein EYC84_009802 [Monilinia fructicola]